MKLCHACGDEKSLDEFWNNANRHDGKQTQCKGCATARRKKKLAERVPEDDARKSRRNADSHMRRRYGIDVDGYERMLDRQQGTCAVCRNKCTRDNLAIDHDHQTGAVRGLLCWRCNGALGKARDSVELLTKLIAYLENPPGGPEGLPKPSGAYRWVPWDGTKSPKGPRTSGRA